MPASLQLFGSPTAQSGGASVALPFERRTQLIAFLALRRAWVGRAELAALLWPGHDTKLAYSNLRKTLFRLQGMTWAEGLEVQGGALRFVPRTDVADFEAALREGRHADALASWRGTLLAGFDDDASEQWSAWLSFERERLASAWRGAALARLAGDIAPAEGIELSARLLEADPLDEGALQAHMAWLARNGQGAQARQAYREFASRLQEDLGIAPPAELAALNEALSGSPTATPLAAAAPRAAADPGFVGRAVELRRIGEMLSQDDCRLLCLIGPGGVGKTRLARRAMEEFAARFDLAAFVSLEESTAASEVAGLIAREVGVRTGSQADPWQAVVDALRETNALLVLDNFEQLAAEATVLERLLSGCPRIKVLVTSRVRLALAAERLLPVEGMPCPEPEDHDRLEAFDAVRLFVRAARRVQPALSPESEGEAIADICRQVEGLPLALELAGAWTRVLSCAAIAAELRKGTELLHAVDAALPARHASIEVVFERSWELLVAIEREVLARLSVFRGGFALDAARAVAGASLPVLGALADKSLVRKEGDRLHLHPLVQRLAGLKLGQGAAREAAQREHSLHFHRLAAQLRRKVEDGDREALARMDIEVANLLAAWRWAAAHAEVEAITRSMTTLLHFCDHRGRFAEGLRFLRTALDAPGVQRCAALRPRLLAAAAHLQYRLDRYADAEADAGRALAATEDSDTRLQCFKVLGGCALRTGRLDDARRHFRQALDEAPAEADPHNAAAMLDNLALIEKRAGNYAEALRLSIESLAQHRRLDDVAGVALCLNNLGSFHLERGEYAAALPHLREALALSEQHGHATTRALALANLSEIALKTGEDAEAEAHGERAIELARAAGNRGLSTHVEMQMAIIAARRGRHDEARARLAAAIEAGIAVGRPSLLLTGVAAFADLLAARGVDDCARAALAFAAGHPSIGATERDELRARLARDPAPAPAWPGMELAELAHRIVAERDLAYAPLVALIRGR